jgi:hypothetical protein
MGNDKRDEEKEKGFVVKDKRFSAKKEDGEESKIKEEAKRKKNPRDLSRGRCTRNRGRTCTPLLKPDFESSASTDSAIRAWGCECTESTRKRVIFLGPYAFS